MIPASVATHLVKIAWVAHVLNSTKQLHLVSEDVVKMLTGINRMPSHVPSNGIKDPVDAVVVGKFSILVVKDCILDRPPEQASKRTIRTVAVHVLAPVLHSGYPTSQTEELVVF